MTQSSFLFYIVQKDHISVITTHQKKRKVSVFFLYHVNTLICYLLSLSRFCSQRMCIQTNHAISQLYTTFNNVNNVHKKETVKQKTGHKDKTKMDYNATCNERKSSRQHNNNPSLLSTAKQLSCFVLMQCLWIFVVVVVIAFTLKKKHSIFFSPGAAHRISMHNILDHVSEPFIRSSLFCSSTSQTLCVNAFECVRTFKGHRSSFQAQLGLYGAMTVRLLRTILSSVDIPDLSSVFLSLSRSLFSPNTTYTNTHYHQSAAVND